MGDDTPQPSYSSRHSIDVSASPERCYSCLREIDMGRSLTMRALLAARGLRHLRTLDAAVKAGFVVLRDEAPREMTLGLVGQPWRPSGNLRRLSSQGFEVFDEPGFVKVLWSFTVVATPGGCSVSTRTDIYATDAAARRRFGRYWLVVKPFSGLLRRSMLRSIRICAEGAPG